MTTRTLRFSLTTLVACLLAACGGSDSGTPELACPDTGPYGCVTGETEPLYTFQWALNYPGSYFKDFPETFSGGLDLNVEPVHRQGIKGKGVNVLVLDTGVDIENEDLAPNARRSMSWNFRTGTDDPASLGFDAHGTVVAGIIAAAQNGKGVMGIAPQVNLGGANLLESGFSLTEYSHAYGNAPWSSATDIFNASYTADTYAVPYESETDGETALLRGLKHLRGGKGAVFIKGAGNSFDDRLCGYGPAYYDCSNPVNDLAPLESNIIVIAALNAMGLASSYSSAGSTIWVTGMGGEYGPYGTYGEGTGPNTEKAGPTIFGTDIRGCIHGISTTNERTPFLRGQSIRNGLPDNPDCDYAYMNGTSSATPTISGVAALMLSANPELTWRDARDILRQAARKVDPDYIQGSPWHGDKPYGGLYDLVSAEQTADMGSPADILDGATRIPQELGWQTNGAGLEYSNWYGFGVPDAARAVALAQEYARNPALSRRGDVIIPDFSPIALWHEGPLTIDDEPPPPLIRTGPFPYKRVTRIGALPAPAQTVDQFQVRLSGNNVCLGSLGIAVKSPSGTVSILKNPDDHFRANGIDTFEDYGLASYAFHGEAAQGDWEIFALASNPAIQIEVGRPDQNDRSKIVNGISTPCPGPANDKPQDFEFLVEARVIGQ